MGTVRCRTLRSAGRCAANGRAPNGQALPHDAAGCQGASIMCKAIRAIVICAAIAALPPPASATKPCLPPPCETNGGQTDIAKCRALADWIATGTIVNVVHHQQGDPLFKDFAEFTFAIQALEKGAGMVDRDVRFQVGWCENTQPLPKDTSGTYRIYGVAFPTDRSVPNQYLHFEPVEAQRR
jgi:hypothetical protein